MSGPVGGIIGTLVDHMADNNEFSSFIKDEHRQRIFRGIFDSYYGEACPDIVFDTNRAWCARMPLLQTIFPGSKIIACVRDTSWVVDSIERLIRKNNMTPSSIFNYQGGGTVYSRAETVASPGGMLGYAYNALKEAFYSEHAEHLMLVQYETLTSEPQTVLNAIYDFIHEPAFKHDSENVEFDAEEFDRKAGIPGLHAVRQRVAPNHRTSILPPDIFNRFASDAFWKNPEFNPHNVRII
ncbi:MAG: sulfotransferase family protein [Verrucomicrobiaceae bacterium]|nr:sulfotransferase family protein [Verrucomicrobiaceae bacterium]